MMKVGGIVSKLMKHSELAGGLLGFLTGSTQGFEDVRSSFENLLSGQVHFPDVSDMINSYLGQPYFKNALYLYLFGWISKELGLPVIGKHGEKIKKFAQAYGGGSFLNMALWHMTHSDEGSNPGGSGGFSTGNQTGYPY